MQSYRMTKQERDELLHVATQLAAAMNANGWSNLDFLRNLNSQAIKAAIDLIEKVDAECGE